MNDAPIDEVREIRQRISARFENDPARLVDHYINLQEQFRDRLIDPPQASDDKDQTAA